MRWLVREWSDRRCVANTPGRRMQVGIRMYVPTVSGNIAVRGSRATGWVVSSARSEIHRVSGLLGHAHLTIAPTRHPTHACVLSTVWLLGYGKRVWWTILAGSCIVRGANIDWIPRVVGPILLLLIWRSRRVPVSCSVGGCPVVVDRSHATVVRSCILLWLPIALSVRGWTCGCIQSALKIADRLLRDFRPIKLEVCFRRRAQCLIQSMLGDARLRQLFVHTSHPGLGSLQLLLETQHLSSINTASFWAALSRRVYVTRPRNRRRHA